MLCPKCGTDVPNGIEVCPTCGNVVTIGNENSSNPSTFQQPTDNYPNMNQDMQGGAGFAIASMVCGICAIVLGCCFYYVSWILAIVGIVLGALALKRQTKGRGMAIAGLVCSIVALAFFVVMLITAGSLLSVLNTSLYK